MTEEVIKKPIILQSIIGLPPSSHVSDAPLRNSMPVLEIKPCLPGVKMGLNLFKLKLAWKTVMKDMGYSELLALYGYALPDTQQCVKVAFIADSFPSDSFSNEYSESFLNKITDIAGEKSAEIMQMTGQKSALSAMQNMGEAVGKVGGLPGQAGTAVANAAKWAEDKANLGAMGSSVMGKLSGTAIGMLSKTLAGQRVDFPTLWKGSGFSPSYSITCRLYNPNPRSSVSTEKYIVGPIAALLCLCLPRTDDGTTYKWPYIHKINCTGLFDLKAAAITSVTVIKGGDQQQIAWNQRLGMVDVRIDFISLYASMLAGKRRGKEGFAETDRSTLNSYLINLRGGRKVHDMYKAPPGMENVIPKQKPRKVVPYFNPEYAPSDAITYEPPEPERKPLVQKVSDWDDINQEIGNTVVLGKDIKPPDTKEIKVKYADDEGGIISSITGAAGDAVKSFKDTIENKKKAAQDYAKQSIEGNSYVKAGKEQLSSTLEDAQNVSEYGMAYAGDRVNAGTKAVSDALDYLMPF